MTLQQLRCLYEVYRQGLNLSRAARVLHTSQPAITRMIRSLEQELEIEILVRSGRKISSVHENAFDLIPRAQAVLQAVEDLRIAAGESKSPTRGVLRVATSHLHIRYALVEPIRRFSALFPDVHLDLIDGSTEEIAKLVISGGADMGISRMPGNTADHLVKLDAYPLSRCLITPPGHALLKKAKPSLQDISRYPLIAAHNRYETITVILSTFAAAGITPVIKLKVPSVDAAKTYVAAGVGIGITQVLAVDPRDKALRTINVDHLFPLSTCWITLRKDAYLRRFMYEFIRMVAPKWAPAQIEKARQAFKSPQRPVRA
jgi:LysR family cys regulon transcriptional activator